MSCFCPHRALYGSVVCHAADCAWQSSGHARRIEIDAGAELFRIWTTRMHRLGSLWPVHQMGTLR